MTWTDLEPVAKKGAGPHQGGVMMSSTKPSPRYQPFNYVTVRTKLFEGGAAPAWLQKGARVNVQVGSGDHRGMIRLVRGTGYVFGTIARDAHAIRLIIPLLPGQKPGKQQPIPCEFDFHDDWVEITLPSWAKSPGGVPQPALSPEAAEKWKKQNPGKPFVLGQGTAGAA